MKRMLDDEQIFELQELLKKVSITSEGVVNINKIHTEELTISDNGKFDGEGIEAPNINLTSVFENNAGKVLAVNEDEDGVVAVEKGTKLYKHNIHFSDGTHEISFNIISNRSSEYTLSEFVYGLNSGEDVITISKEKESDMWLFNPFYMDYFEAAHTLNSYLCEDGNGTLTIKSEVNFDATPTITDTIIEL